MNNKALLSIVSVIILIVLGIAIYTGVHSSSNTNGNLVVAIADPSSDISDISKVNVTIGKVEVHSSLNGWITLSNNAKTYDLLGLNSSGEVEYYGTSKVMAGKYDQVRVTLNGVSALSENGTEIQATLPSPSLLITDTIKVDANQTSAIKLDFHADQSIHRTDNGGIVFAPVVDYQNTADAKVAVQSDGSVAINDGNISSSGTVGMDITGETKPNFSIDSNANLMIGANGSVIIGSSTEAENALNGSTTASTTSSVGIHIGGLRVKDGTYPTSTSDGKPINY